MQASLPFPDSMLVLPRCVLYSSSVTIGTSVLLFQHAVEDRGKACIEWRTQASAGVRRRCATKATSRSSCLQLGTYLDFSPETSAIRLSAYLFAMYCLRSAVLHSHSSNRLQLLQLESKTEKGATDAQGIVGCLLTHDGGWSRAVVSRLLCPSKNSINVESPCGARSECSSGARDWPTSSQLWSCAPVPARSLNANPGCDRQPSLRHCNSFHEVSNFKLKATPCLPITARTVDSSISLLTCFLFSAGQCKAA